MDIKALRQFVQEHPDGVVIRMVDGSEYEIPHRDYIWFTPNADAPENRGTRFATSFYVASEGVAKLVNALVVKEVLPLVKRGTQRGSRTRRRKAG